MKTTFRTANGKQFVVATSTRADGNMAFGHGIREEVERNRAAFYSHHNLSPENVQVITLSHSASIEVVTPEGRTIISRDPQVQAHSLAHFNTTPDGLCLLHQQGVLGVLTGDCLPVAVFSDDGTFRAILHIGLLGVVNELVTTVGEVLSSYNIKPSTITVVSGPSLSGEHYNLAHSGLWKGIGEQVLTKVPWMHTYLEQRAEGIFCDTGTIVNAQFSVLGIPSERIHRWHEGTGASDSPYFSHYSARNHGRENGRHLTILYEESL